MGGYTSTQIPRLPFLTPFLGQVAIHFDPKEGTVFFQFNPLGVNTFEMVLDTIRLSLVEHLCKIRIAYLHALCESLMPTQDWLESGTVFSNIKPAV